jgi:hypothetical protein
MSSARFEPGSFMTERERSTNWAINHWNHFLQNVSKVYSEIEEQYDRKVVWKNWL